MITCARKDSELADKIHVAAYFLLFILVASVLPVSSYSKPFSLISASGDINYFSRIEVTVDPNVQIYVNSLSTAVKLDHEWKRWRDTPALRQLAKDAEFKIINSYTVKSDSPDPCIRWNESSKTGTWDWTKIDSLSQKIIEIGAEPMFSLCLYDMSDNYLPRGMSVNPDTNLPYPDQFAAYCGKWVKHFKDVGIPVIYYEINEEGFEYFGWNGANGLSMIRNYIEVWNAAARSMRAVDPTIKISDDSITMRKVFDAWLQYGDDVDFLDFHKYDSSSLSGSGYKGDAELLALAETRCYENSPSFYGVNEARQMWLDARGELLPVINHETNLNSHWSTGTDVRIRQMIGAVWHALMLRVSVLKGLSYVFYYSFATSSSINFGMVNYENNQPYYPYYVYEWLGNNLSVGDAIVESSSSSDEVRVLSWTHNGTLNIFLICKLDQPRTVFLSGIAGELSFSKIDNATSSVQTSVINSTEPLIMNGYTVALLQMSLFS